MADQSAPPPEPSPEVGRIQGLWSVFGKGSEAFAVHQDLDLSVRQGEMLALVGGSGTCKTVLLRQMLGLLHPARGSVTVLGRPAEDMGGDGAAGIVQPSGSLRRKTAGLRGLRSVAESELAFTRAPDRDPAHRQTRRARSARR